MKGDGMGSEDGMNVQDDMSTEDDMSIEDDAIGSDDGADDLHEIMVRATRHLAGVRPDPERLRRARRRRRAQETAAVVATLATVVAVAGFTLRSVRSGSGGVGPAGIAVATPARTTPADGFPPDYAHIDTAEVYDAVDGTEGAGKLGAFLLGTGPWQTYQYCNPHPTAENRVKPGTGLILDLGMPTSVGSIDFTGSAGTVEVWAADASVTSMPPVLPFQPPAGFHKTDTRSATGVTRFSSRAKVGTITRFLLIWYTALPETPPSGATNICHSQATYSARLDKVSVILG